MVILGLTVQSWIGIRFWGHLYCDWYIPKETGLPAEQSPAFNLGCTTLNPCCSYEIADHNRTSFLTVWASCNMPSRAKKIGPRVLEKLQNPKSMAHDTRILYAESQGFIWRKRVWLRRERNIHTDTFSNPPSHKEGNKATHMSWANGNNTRNYSSKVPSSGLASHLYWQIQFSTGVGKEGTNFDGEIATTLIAETRWAWLGFLWVCCVTKGEWLETTWMHVLLWQTYKTSHFQMNITKNGITG